MPAREAQTLPACLWLVGGRWYLEGEPEVGERAEEGEGGLVQQPPQPADERLLLGQQQLRRLTGMTKGVRQTRCCQPGSQPRRGAGSYGVQASKLAGCLTCPRLTSLSLEQNLASAASCAG